MNMQEQIDNFLQTLKSQREAGLIVLTNTSNFATVEEYLIKDKFVESKDWKQVLKQLGNDQSTFVYMNGEFSKEYYDLLKQYSERGSMIQIMNTITMNYETINLNPMQTKLVYLMTKDALGWAEDKFSIRDKFGLIEIIN